MTRSVREYIEQLEDKTVTHPLATKSKDTKGRLKAEKEDPIRPCYQRDAHRLLYSTAFRRLRHKTQVFFNPEHDHISTRMDHSLFVASISQTIARALGLNEDLVYAIALGHDIGHPPFGHKGEEIIQQLAQVVNKDFLFQHEIHSLRVVDELTWRPSTQELGLNLTYEVRDGIVSHWGESRQQYISPRPKEEVVDLKTVRERDVSPYTLEACVVKMVDRIAYIGRDYEDAALAPELGKLPPLPKTITEILGADNRAIINALVHDLIDENKKQEERVGFSSNVYGALNELYAYNLNNIYSHPKIIEYAKKTEGVMRAIFEHAINELNNKRQQDWGKWTALDPEPVKKLHQFIKGAYTEVNLPPALQIVVDYISLMTDRFALRLFEKLAIPMPVG